MCGILCERIDLIPVQRSGIIDLIPENGESAAIVFIQPIVSTEPHETFMVLKKTGYHVIGQAMFYPDIFYRRVCCK
jgi:hypothetical protein